MTKKRLPIGLEVDTTYLRPDGETFSLPPKGCEGDIPSNVCSFYTHRAGGATPAYVVNTYSVGGLDHTLSKMLVPTGGDITVLRGPGVSAHYLVDQDGTVLQLVPDSKQPWTAGAGFLGGKLGGMEELTALGGMNARCLSIMYINDGRSPLTPQQLESGLKLTHHLVDTHKIDPTHVIGLADWTTRHIAPGPYFPWDIWGHEHLGAWADFPRSPEPTVLLYSAARNDRDDVAHVQQQLAEWGVLGDHTTGVLDNPTLNVMVRFNLHHDGARIVKDPGCKALYDIVLHANSSQGTARKVLGEWTTNSETTLAMLLSGEHHGPDTSGDHEAPLLGADGAAMHTV